MKVYYDATLFVGSDSDSRKAEHLVKDSGLTPRIIFCTENNCDFDPPLLIHSNGVFDSLDSISWFVGTIQTPKQ